MNSSSKKLDGRVAFVTGGASGIGLAIAERFVSEGARMVLADLNRDLLNQAERKLGDVSATVKTNVAVEADIEHAIAFTVERFGRVDIAVNSAGLGTYGIITELTEEQWDTIADTCLKGIFLSMKHEGLQMTKQASGGVIINISSLNSTQPGEGMAPYCASKAGVDMLTRVGAMEMGPNRIRVCGIAPGLVLTPLTDPVWAMPALHEAYLENTPLGRTGTTGDIANAALFLASDEASWISGETLVVDGAAQTKRYPELPKILAAIAGERPA